MRDWKKLHSKPDAITAKKPSEFEQTWETATFGDLKTLINDIAENDYERSQFWDLDLPLKILNAKKPSLNKAQEILHWIASELKSTKLSGLVVFSREFVKYSMDENWLTEMAYRICEREKGTTVFNRFKKNIATFATEIEELKKNSDFILYGKAMQSLRTHNWTAALETSLEGIEEFGFEPFYYKAGVYAATLTEMHAKTVEIFEKAPSSLIRIADSKDLIEPSLFANVIICYNETKQFERGLSKTNSILSAVNWENEKNVGLLFAIAILFAGLNDLKKSSEFLLLVSKSPRREYQWADIQNQSELKKILHTPEFQKIKEIFDAGN